MLKKTIYPVVLAILLSVVLTACSPFTRPQGIVPDMQPAESSVPVSNENSAIIEQLDNMIALGDPIPFTDNETGKSHEVRIQGSKVYSSLGEAKVAWEFVADYLINAGYVDSAGVVQGGRKLLVIDVEVIKLVNGVPNEYIKASEQLEWFSLSGALIIDNKGELAGSEMIGYVQPDASKLPDVKNLYVSNFPNVGDTYDCRLVYFVDDSMELSDMRMAFTNGEDAIVAAIAEQGGS